MRCVWGFLFALDKMCFLKKQKQCITFCKSSEVYVQVWYRAVALMNLDEFLSSHAWTVAISHVHWWPSVGAQRADILIFLGSQMWRQLFEACKEATVQTENIRWSLTQPPTNKWLCYKPQEAQRFYFEKWNFAKQSEKHLNSQKWWEYLLQRKLGGSLLEHRPPPLFLMALLDYSSTSVASLEKKTVSNLSSVQQVFTMGLLCPRHSPPCLEDESDQTWSQFTQGSWSLVC